MEREMLEVEKNAGRYIALRDALMGKSPENLEAFFMRPAPESANEFDAAVDKTLVSVS